MECVSIEFAVHGTEVMPSSRQARMTRTAISPVGDQDFGEHVLLTSRMTPSMRHHTGIFANSRAAMANIGASHVSSTKSTNTDLAAEARAERPASSCWWTISQRVRAGSIGAGRTTVRVS